MSIYDKDADKAQEQLDKISPSMCYAKWSLVSMHLTNGMTHSCYHPPTHKVPLEELEKVKASVTAKNWNAQYMQDPTSEEGAILKREWWRTYTGEDIPQLHHVIQSYDTAFLKKETKQKHNLTKTEYVSKADTKSIKLQLGI